MRRLLALAALTSLIAAGCAGDEDSSGPLDAALAYLPAETPFAAAIDTDLDGDQYEAVDSLLGKFPLGVESVEEALAGQLSGGEQDVDFREDVKPLLGNPFVVGATDVRSFTDDSEDDDFVGAIQVEDEDALERLLDETKPSERGERSGATVYEDAGTVFAVEEDMVVFAGSEQLLDEALERADGDDHLDEESFGEALEGLPRSALVRVYADVEAIIAADPDARAARKVEWVRALRTLGSTLVAEGEGLEIEFNLRTEGERLSDEDLPVAAGDEAPGVVERNGEIGFGIRDLAQIVKFSEAAGQALDPSGYGDYARAKETLDRQLGISIDEDLIGQLGGHLSASVAVDGKLGLRSELDDPRAFEDTLAKLADALPSFAEGAGFGQVAIQKPEGDNDFYVLAQADGDSLVFGVIEETFVLATDPEGAAALATEGPLEVPGAVGALAMSADAEALVNALLGELGPQLGLGGLEGFGAQLFTGPLEELTGSVRSSTGGLRGRVSLSVR
ncbi:MAG TPA: DUF3352 domain-containing protein [Thermoleophilaceae bacterium]|nr:DUF3352 domain-containing protein [Thermoleophilaceae bacterium]